jgi:predicted glycogen debranching enzyme
MNNGDINSYLRKEWLETNGLGGYASSSVCGANTRKYHGLLVASLSPPVERVVVVSKLDETICINDQRFELGTNQYPGVIYPAGYKYLKSFDRDFFPVFQYKVNGITLQKTIAAIQGENTTLILYEVIQAKGNFSMELLPLYAYRDFHSLAHANTNIGQQYLFADGVFRTLNYQGGAEFFISVPGSTFTEHKDWYYNVEFALEQERGLDYKEDLYTHGSFSVALKQGDTLGVIISTTDPARRDAFKLFDKETKRREEVVHNFTANHSLKRLALAADQFVVKREKLKTVIAGYHWFCDWGRDTMISLPGLCLTTGRFDDAKKIIKSFAESISEGMLPNRFPDHGEVPEYNTVDATLWFFQAIYKYYNVTKDTTLIKLLLPVLKECIAWHYKGTRYNIHVDADDELLYAGQDGVQLTWMDAKVGDWVVTPRRGKAVEINALWYNALKIIAYLITEAGSKTEAIMYEHKADKVMASFTKQFYNTSQNYLYDYIDGDYKNDDLRPNQLYAISLPFPLLQRDKATMVLDSVTNFLLTPKGLRSLSSVNVNYKPTYSGTVWSRDGAYHQGTVWSYLLGPYVDALFYVKGTSAKPEATKYITEFFKHLDEAGIGTVSEIFDGEAPHTPRGCIAQAWGVAEVLRASVQYDLFGE